MGGIARENNRKNYGNWIKFGGKSVTPNTANWFSSTFRSLALTALDSAAPVNRLMKNKNRQDG